MNSPAIRFLDAVHLALTIHLVYHSIVESFGKPEGVDEIIWYVSINIKGSSCSLTPIQEPQGGDCFTIVYTKLIESMYLLSYRHNLHFMLVLYSALQDMIAYVW